MSCPRFQRIIDKNCQLRTFAVALLLGDEETGGFFKAQWGISFFERGVTILRFHLRVAIWRVVDLMPIMP